MIISDNCLNLQSVTTVFLHIQYLLTTHDCVVVPGFGAFVAQYSPAALSDNGTLMSPPVRMVGFNAAITHDDGLLISSVARREAVSYDEARTQVANFVELLRNRIELEHQVELPRLGVISSGNSHLLFSPDDDIANAPYAGLQQLSLSPIAIDADKNDDVHEVRMLPRSYRYRMLRSVSRYAAAVVVLAAMGVTLSNPIVVDKLTPAKASLAVNVTAPKNIVVEAPEVEEVQESVSQPEPVITLLVPAPKVVPVTDMKECTDYSCYIIVASCASQAEAQRFIANRHAEDSMKILKSDGRYRVYTAVSNDYDAAYAYKSAPDFAAAHPNAWVYQASI